MLVWREKVYVSCTLQNAFATRNQRSIDQQSTNVPALAAEGVLIGAYRAYLNVNSTGATISRHLEHWHFMRQELIQPSAAIFHYGL